MQLIDKFMENKFTKQVMDEWQITISTSPLVCDGVQLSPGNLIFGDNKKVSLAECGNLHRDGQGQMFQGGNLGNVVVFYEQKSNNDCKKFVDMLKQVLDYYKMKFNQIKNVAINQMRNERDIQQAAQENLNQSVGVCFWILPGKKKAGINYDKIKRLLVNELPVPS
jgi:aubergine-like protein